MLDFEGSIRDLVRRFVSEELAARSADDWVDQKATKLGRRRHIAYVRGLIAAGKPGAAQRGRSYFLKRSVHDGFLSAEARRAPVARDEAIDAIARELGL